MAIRDTPSHVDLPGTLAAFHSAADDWHDRCRRAFLQHDRCRDRFVAMIDALVTWMTEHPGQARLYWGDDDSCPHPELLVHAVAARQAMTRIVLDAVPAGRTAVPHHVRVEFLVGLVREVVREELRRHPVDHAHLAQKLTRLTPLLMENDYQSS